MLARQNSMDCILNVTWLIYSHKWRVTIQLRPNMDSTRYKSPGLTYLLTYLHMDCILHVTWPFYDYK